MEILASPEIVCVMRAFHLGNFSCHVEDRRKLMVIDWMAREYMAKWSRVAGLSEDANRLESLQRITSWTMFRMNSRAVKAILAARKNAKEHATAILRQRGRPLGSEMYSVIVGAANDVTRCAPDGVAQDEGLFLDDGDPVIHAISYHEEDTIWRLSP